MMNLDNYKINYDGFTGSIDLFFSYVKNKRDILKTFSLSSIIEGFILFIEEIEIQVEDLINFYKFSSDLFYLKSQIVFPSKLNFNRSKKKIIKKLLIDFNNKHEKMKVISKNNSDFNLEINTIKDFVLLNDNNNKNQVLISAKKEDNVEVKEKKMKTLNSSKSVVKEKEKIEKLMVDKFKSFEVEISNKKYKTRILEKKMKIVNILRKEDYLIFESLLDFNKGYYFFDRFCYFLISLEYKMSDVVDLFYKDKNLILKKGKNINRYG